MTDNQSKSNTTQDSLCPLAGKHVMVDELGNLTSDGTRLEIVHEIAEQGRLAGRFVR